MTTAVAPRISSGIGAELHPQAGDRIEGFVAGIAEQQQATFRRQEGKRAAS